jgi:hypothetical protein
LKVVIFEVVVNDDRAWFAAVDEVEDDRFAVLFEGEVSWVEVDVVAAADNMDVCGPRVLDFISIAEEGELVGLLLAAGIVAGVKSSTSDGSKFVVNEADATKRNSILC